jgi:HigB_toxin, RelE-like toxic component of a toxin-antitoxin system
MPGFLASRASAFPCVSWAISHFLISFLSALSLSARCFAGSIIIKSLNRDTFCGKNTLKIRRAQCCRATAVRGFCTLMVLFRIDPRMAFSSGTGFFTSNPKSPKYGAFLISEIKGNQYRLIALIIFRKRTVFILFIGSHKEYDKINASKVQYKK